MFGLIRKAAVKAHVDRAVMSASKTLRNIFEAEKTLLRKQYDEKIDFLLAEKDAEIAEYCRQNTALRDVITRIERDKEDVKQGAIENSRLANSIDRIAKNILDTTDTMRVELLQSISSEIKKYYETLGVHWQTTTEIVNDTRAQQRKVLK